MCIGLHGEYPLFLSALMKPELSQQFFEYFSNIKFHAKSVQWDPNCTMRTDRHYVASSHSSQMCEERLKLRLRKQIKSRFIWGVPETKGQTKEFIIR